MEMQHEHNKVMNYQRCIKNVDKLQNSQQNYRTDYYWQQGFDQYIGYHARKQITKQKNSMFIYLLYLYRNANQPYHANGMFNVAESLNFTLISLLKTP